jgi:2-keto-3-deoxy-galactonokinase
MLNKIKNACSWVVSQVQAGIFWVRNNWPEIRAKAEVMVRRAYEVAMDQIRKAVVAFMRGMVIGIETVEKRQSMPFKEALAEAKAVVKAMSGEQVCAYAVYWFRREAAQVTAV